jgi:hypothetical protein
LDGIFNAFFPEGIMSSITLELLIQDEQIIPVSVGGHDAV